MNQAELLRYVAEILDALDIPYMVTGSQASVYYGEPRFTQDLDIVADLTTARVGAFMARFPAPEFYVSEFAIREAIATHGQFNVIHPGSGLKIDVMIRKDTAYHRAEFERRQRQPILPGTQAWFARPEDVIISKLLSVQQGGSDRHLRDVAGILRVSAGEIDLGYVQVWVERLDLAEIWAAVQRRVARG